MEASEDRARRLATARQRRYRLRRQAKHAAEGEQLAARPQPGSITRADSSASRLPAHSSQPAFGLAAELALDSVEEARRYSRYVRQLAPSEALMPLKAGSSPPASEARHQREAAIRALTALAATPLSAARILRDITQAVDLAAEYAKHQRGETNLLDGHVPLAISSDGYLLVDNQDQK